MTGISDIFLNGIRPASDAPSSNVSGDGLSYLSSLKNGDTFTAKVTSVSGSDITLKLPTGGTVNAKLSSEMNISQGQTISFEVKNGGSTVSITPLLTNTSADISVLKALNQAQLPVSDTSVGMTTEMMKAGLSIDRSSLLGMYEKVMNNPSANVSDIVDLTRLGLPVNEENLGNIENYKNLSYQIDSGLQTLAEKTDQALMDMVKGGDVTNAAKLMSSIIDASVSFMDEGISVEEFVRGPENPLAMENPELEILAEENELSAGTEGIKDSGKTQDNLPISGQAVSEQASGDKASEVKADAASRALELLKNLNVSEDVSKPSVNNDNPAKVQQPSEPLTSEISQAPVREGADLVSEFDKVLSLYREISGDKEYVPADMKDLLTKLSAFVQKAAVNGDIDNLNKLVSSDPLKKLAFGTLKDMWSISPSEVADKDKVEFLYKRLSSQLNMLKDGLVSAGAQNTPALNAANNMSSNIDFLQQINQMYAYIQLPLKLSGGESAHGDLYVFSNRKNMTSDDSVVTAFMHLDMDNLGPVDVYVSMDINAGGKVSTNFTVADDDTLDFLEKNMHLLTERLQKRGYDLQASMKIKDDEESTEENALDKGGVNLLLVHAGGTGSYKGSMRSFDVRA
ncbi:MAG: flagellar hook-length control protein FliK [Lachnospiraceae bacterium]|nr:flagellar hook-length control protein FliK [Lachnospiraceae bacterium]